MSSTSTQFNVGITPWLDYKDGVFAAGTDFKELSLDELLNIKREDTCLNFLTIDGREYSSKHLGSYDVAAIAKNLLKPLVEGTLKYPFSVYVSALSNEYCENDLGTDAEDFEGKLHGETEYNLSNIVAWVEANYVSHSISHQGHEDLYLEHMQKRVDKVMAEIKDNMPMHHDFIERFISLTTDSSEDPEFLETDLYIDGEYTTALFHFYRNMEQNMALFTEV